MLSLFLTQAALGSILVLLLVPPRAAGRKFFQLTTAQAALLILLGQILVIMNGGTAPADRASTPMFLAAALLLMISAGLFHLGRLTAGWRLMLAALPPAAAAAARDALALVPSSDASILSLLLYPLDALTSGVLTGSVLIAMILGHYYLNVPGLSISHLQRLSVVCMAAVAARCAVLAVSVAVSGRALAPTLALLLDTGGTSLPEGGLDPFVGVFLLVHVLAGIIGTGILSVMIWRTAKISSTQSATGILYVALIMVIMGELASRHLITQTNLPL